MPVIYLIRGLPGSGKTTHARKLATSIGCIHLEADMLCCSDGQYKWSKDLHPLRHQKLLAVATVIMCVNADIVVSNVFSKKEELKAFIDEAIFCGYQVKVIKCYRSFGTVHGVPESTISEMAARWEDFEGEELVNYGELL